MDRGIYPEDFAESLKQHTGRKYRPANGTEGEMFMERYCYSCNFWKDNGCPINLASVMFDVDDKEYPSQWMIGPDGQPTCTSFEGNKDG